MFTMLKKTKLHTPKEETIEDMIKDITFEEYFSYLNEPIGVYSINNGSLTVHYLRKRPAEAQGYDFFGKDEYNRILSFDNGKGWNFSDGICGQNTEMLLKKSCSSLADAATELMHWFTTEPSYVMDDPDERIRYISTNHYLSISALYVALENRDELRCIRYKYNSTYTIEKLINFLGNGTYLVVEACD